MASLPREERKAHLNYLSFMELEHEQDFCLLIPCYNNYDGLMQSLKTIVYPSDNYTILIVDDGSEQEIVVRDIKKDLDYDLPVKVIAMRKNAGITAALNYGLRWILENVKCKYIARLDCGDRCDPNRFVIQVDTMNGDESLQLLGSWCRFEGKDGEGYLYKTPTGHAEIERSMYFRNVFIHPTVMYRLSTVKTVGLYPVNFEYAEDYAYFWEMIRHGKSMVINKTLVICEINEGGISFANKSKQLAARWKVVKRYGSSWWLKTTAHIRLILLFILPKRLTLYLKKWKG